MNHDDYAAHCTTDQLKTEATNLYPKVFQVNDFEPQDIRRFNSLRNELTKRGIRAIIQPNLIFRNFTH